MPDEVKRAAIYARAWINEREDPDDQISRQIEHCRELAARRRLEVVEVLADAAAGEPNYAERPAFRRLFEKMADWDVLVCDHADVVSRNDEELWWIAEVLGLDGKEAYDAAEGAVIRPEPPDSAGEPRSTQLGESGPRRPAGQAEERSYEPLSRLKLTRILRQHAAWLREGKPETPDGGTRRNGEPTPERARLASADLSELFLPGVDLREADLHASGLRNSFLACAHFDRADVSESHLENAHLVNASFEGADLRESYLGSANLRGAVFASANLADAHLAQVRGLLARRLAGAHVGGAELPDEIKGFEARATVETAAGYARTIFFAMLAACVYTLLTVAGTDTATVLAGTSSASLPIVSTKVPIWSFYFLAPPVLSAVYLYFLVCMQNIWQRLANLPAYLPDGRRLDLAANPWLLVGFVGSHLALLRDTQTPVKTLQRMLSVFMAWWVVPLTLGAVWFDFLPARLPGLTAWHIFVLAATSVAGLSFGRLAVMTLRGRAGRKALSASTTLRRLGRFAGEAIVGASIVVACATASAAVFLGWVVLPQQSLEGQDLSDREPAALQQLAPYLDGADLHGVNLSLRDLSQARMARVILDEARLRRTRLLGADLSGAQLQSADLSDALLDGANLAKADLRGANLSGARMAGVTLEGANLRGATLSGARIEGSRMRGVILQGATLHEVLITGDLTKADLRQARLEGAVLTGVNLTKAKLNDAVLSRAILNKAILEGAMLEGAVLTGASLRGARLGGAVILNGNLVSADLHGAKLQGANLRGADLTGASLGAAELNGAVLSDATLDRVKAKSANFEGAFLDRAKLRGARLRGANLKRSRLRGADLSGAQLQNAQMKGAKLDRARLNGANLEGVTGLDASTLRGSCGDADTKLPEGLSVPRCPVDAAAE